MFLRIENLPQKKLIGQRIKTSLSENRTFELWKSFMPRKREIKNVVNNNLYSIQVFDSSFKPETFTPKTIFEKWAAVEVTNFDNVPENMEVHVLTGGLYAVFLHKGAATDFKTHQYIFSTWLPQSNYTLDAREQFEVMDERYKGNDPASEEEVWIPIKDK